MFWYFLGQNFEKNRLNFLVFNFLSSKMFILISDLILFNVKMSNFKGHFCYKNYGLILSVFPYGIFLLSFCMVSFVNYVKFIHGSCFDFERNSDHFGNFKINVCYLLCPICLVFAIRIL